jgi:ribosomal protein S18 acetylase RimI-like enzyme
LGGKNILQKEKLMKRLHETYKIREMKIKDYEELINIWTTTSGLSIDEEDSREKTKIFLDRNPGLSFVALCSGKIIGTIKGAQDGRRGYISHMVVIPKYRSSGIAKTLIELTLNGLINQGINKCNLYVLDNNEEAISFWIHNGWKVLEYDFRMLQRKIIT